MAAMSKRKMTRAKIADAYHQIESMRAQRPRMDLNKKSLPNTKNTKAIPQHESFYLILARIKFNLTLGNFLLCKMSVECIFCS